MNKYLFYCEFDGRKTLSNPYAHPTDTIHSDGISSAIKKFSKKNKLKQTGYDTLKENEYRVFFNKRVMFGESRELIYYVQTGVPDGPQSTIPHQFVQ